ncbi:precorrin-3B synthase [Tunturibacter gelidoferens]|uniref:Precorrin-3B synthase n=2 Tax=Tunturiibacter gelidiferens TaxID=3069689 RepID=A0AAU7Z805_9BACT
MRVGESFCPGILHAVQAKDGLLTRIRVPGGMITPSQLTAVAELSASFADGNVDITSRSNIQLRAIKTKDLSSLVHGLDLAGFLPSPLHDRIRNIVASPFAGLGFGEILDTQPFVRELDRRLIADHVIAGLPPKFSFAIDGGGRWFGRDCDDLALRAVNVDNTPLFHLAIGGILSGFGVRVDEAVDCILEAAKMCVEISKELEMPARGRKIASAPRAMNRLLDALSDFLVACPFPDGLGDVDDMPVGIYPCERVGFVDLVPSVPLGRLTAEQIRCMASIAKRWDGDIRLAPWRGVVLGSIPESSVSQITAKLEAVGLSSDGKDGYRGVAACAGIVGCDASLADVRHHASLLALRLAGRYTQPGWTVNISGCEKQCAMRSGATAELIASSSGYSLRINGQFIASNCSLESAIDNVAACQAEIPIEVFS